MRLGGPGDHLGQSKECGFLMAASKPGKWLRSPGMRAFSVLRNHHSAAWRMDPVAVGGEELRGLRDTYSANLLRTWRHKEGGG